MITIKNGIVHLKGRPTWIEMPNPEKFKTDLEFPNYNHRNGIAEWLKRDYDYTMTRLDELIIAQYLRGKSFDKNYISMVWRALNKGLMS